MAIDTSTAVDIGADFVRASVRGRGRGGDASAYGPGPGLSEVNPGGFVEVLGVETLVEKVRAEIEADGGWATLFVEGEPAGHKVRVHASVRFVRDGRARSATTGPSTWNCATGGYGAATWRAPAPSRRELFAAAPMGKDLRRRHRPLGVGRVYLNFVGDEGADRIRAAFEEEKYRRPSRIKAEYDPDNVFRGNQNSEPALAGARR